MRVLYFAVLCLGLSLLTAAGNHKNTADCNYQLKLIDKGIG